MTKVYFAKEKETYLYRPIYIQRCLLSHLVSPYLHLSEKFSSGTINPKQTNKQTNQHPVSVLCCQCQCCRRKLLVLSSSLKELRNQLVLRMRTQKPRARVTPSVTRYRFLLLKGHKCHTKCDTIQTPTA